MGKRDYNLSRLFSPRSIAFVGGAIARMAIRRSVEMGYQGAIWPVHPNRESVEGIRCYRSVDDLPSAPDAAHIGVNRDQTIRVVGQLSKMGAGGCVCYAAGFAEMGSEGKALEDSLVEAAGDMPLIGPNTFGFLNFLDRCALWPYLFGCGPVERGVALISQSGNIAMNLTMNRRSVRFSHVIGTGNQSVLGPGELVEALLDDPRVTGIGMYLEGIDDLEVFSRAAVRALEQGVPIVVTKVGRTEAAARQSSTHTSSLTGSDRLHDALFRRLGIIRVHSLNRMLETLKLFDLGRPPRGRNVISLSCSGGEASIMADLSDEYGLKMEPFSDRQMADLNAQFENYVTVSNPFDYNTSIWGDGDAQTRCFTAAMSGSHDAAFLIYDHPSVDDPSVAAEVNEWLIALDSFIAAYRNTGMPAYVVSTVSELLPAGLRNHLIANGVVPLQGFEDGVAAYAAAAGYDRFRSECAQRVQLPRAFNGSRAACGPPLILSERDSKSRLSTHGLPAPAGRIVDAPDAPVVAEQLGFPVVVKAAGGAFLHKSELGAVKLGLRTAEEVRDAVGAISASVEERGGTVDQFLVEKMVTGAVAELIVGIKRDDQFGPALVIAAGGTLVELLDDSVSLLLPVDREAVADALGSLAVAKLLVGFRGGPRGDTEALIDAILCVAAYAEAHWDTLLELDVNPLMVLPEGMGVVAVDALISIERQDQEHHFPSALT